MKGTLSFEFGRCGFGWSGGFLPTVYLGFMHIYWYRGSILAKLAEYEAALAAKVRGIGA